jgi:hypothetical protein
MTTIVIKPGLEVDLAKEPDPGLYELTQVKSGKLEKIYLRF